MNFENECPWLIDIPHEWKNSPLKYLSSISAGATPDKENPVYWNGTIPWVTSVEVKSKLIKDTSYHITESAIRDCSTDIYDAGTLVMVVRSNILSHTLPVSILNKDAAINQDVKAIVTNEAIDPVFLYYFCVGNNKALLHTLSKDKSTMASVDDFRLKSCRIAFPGIDEQRKIATWLDSKVAEIDEAIANFEHSINTFEQYRDSLIFEYTTKGLNPNTKLKKSRYGWLDSYPERWKQTKLKFISRIVCGSTPESSETSYWDGDISWITPADMGDYGRISHGARFLTENGYNSCGTEIVPVGSIVVSCRAPIGKINITTAELCTNQGCKSIVRDADNRFLYYQMLTSKSILESNGRGSTFKELSTQSLENHVCYLPPIEEQREIATQLDSKVAEIDEAIAIKWRLVAKLRDYRTSIINEYVTGKKRVKGAIQ